MFRSASFIGTFFTAVFTIFATSNVDSIVSIPHKIYSMQRISIHIKKLMSLLNVPICTQGMQRSWWPDAGTINVTGPYWISIGSDNGLLPGWHPAIISTNADIYLIWLQVTYLNEISFEIWNIFIQENAFENVICKMSAILSQGRWVNMTLSMSHSIILVHKVYLWR